MPQTTRLPNSIRYIRARLRILKRPMVWGSAAALLLAVLAFSEYWRYPERWVGGTSSLPTGGVVSLDDLNNPTQYNILPSNEDSAIGADIDSLPVLLNDLNAPANGLRPGQIDPLNPQPGIGNPTLERQTSPGLTPYTSPLGFISQERDTTLSALSRDSASRSNASQPNEVDRLFNLDLTGVDMFTGNTSPSTASNRPTQTLTPGGMTAPPAVTSQPSTATTPANPLQDALNRRRTSTGQATAQGSSPQPGFSAAPSVPAAAIGQQPLLANPVSPQIGPPPGTTGYTLPPVLRSVPSSAPSNSTYSVPYSALGRPQPLPGLQAPQLVPVPSGQPGVGQVNLQAPIYGGNQRFPGAVNPYNSAIPNSSQAPQIEYVEPEPLPFTAPYSRGGGEFNTFSNP